MMQKYARNALMVEAVQWFPGVEVAGLVEVKPEIVLNASKTHFYLSTHPQGMKRADAWFPVDPGQVAASPPAGIMPFMFWRVREGVRLPARADDDLVMRYLKYMGWQRLPEPIARMRLSGETKTLVAGQWIVTGPGDQVVVMSDAEFTKGYSPA